MMAHQRGYLSQPHPPHRQRLEAFPDHSEVDGNKATDHPLAMNNLQQQQLMTFGKQKPTPKTNEEKKPRPYTEYNIFFQLERERILGELEKERDGGRDADYLKNEELSKEYDDTVRCQGEIVGLMPSSKDGDVVSHTDARKHHASCSPGTVLNRPSDSNDILPRPDCFAHLQLAPLWYDSTHRLAQSKLNKSRRRHRKTHGLVGFLELTKRIAKAWSECDVETKAYCKRVADRQLKIYKEEMKLAKKTQGTTHLDDLGKNGKGGGVGVGVGVDIHQQAKGQAHQLIGSLESTKNTMCTSHERKMIPPIDPLQLFAPPSSGESASRSSLHHEWQHQNNQHQQHGSYDYFSHHNMQSLRRGGFPPQPYHPPTIPTLTPTSQEYIDGVGDGNVYHSALDELMYRRKLYGSRITTCQGPMRFPGTSRQERSPGTARQNITAEVPNANIAGGNKQPELRGIEKSASLITSFIEHSDSYLSPHYLEESPNEDFHKLLTVAITPSPSRRQVAASPQGQAQSAAEASMTPSSLPMKKRRKILKREEITSVDSDPSAVSRGFGMDASLTPGSTAFFYNKDGSPNSASSDISPMSMLSPSAMITPGLKFGDTPQGELHHRKAFSDDPMISSPLPYIDWGSPHDKSPQESGGGLEYSINNRFTIFPPHLAVPGPSSANWHTIPSIGHAPPPPESDHPKKQNYHSRTSLYSSNPYFQGQSGQVVNNINEQGNHVLDNEVKTMWRKLACHAKQRQTKERDAAMAWMYNQHSPGDNGFFAGDKLKMAHSFASPVERLERPDLVAKGTSLRPDSSSASGNDGGEDSEDIDLQVSV
jgi:hypothetical protein